MARPQQLATLIWTLILTFVAVVVVAALIAVASLVPILLALFPMTIALVAGFFLIGWLRRRRRS